MTLSNTMLDVKQLKISFGGIDAVTGVDMYVNRGELLGLIGPNGAGKTTIFNMLTGVYVPTAGTIELSDGFGKMNHIEGLKPHVVALRGISRTFQNIRLFKELTVMDNLKIAMHKNVKHNIIEALFRLPGYRHDEKLFNDNAVHILKLVNLLDKKDTWAKNLSYGDQRRLEIARAIATGGKLIFLDEPAAGMNPSETEDLRELIIELKNEFNLTIVLIEHDMKFVMNLCERIYVLEFGSIIAEGNPQEIRNNERVIRAYLGEDKKKKQ